MGKGSGGFPEYISQREHCLSPDTVVTFTSIYDTFGDILQTEPQLGGDGKEPPAKATATGEDDFDDLKRRVASLGVKEALELFKYLKSQLGI